MRIYLISKFYTSVFAMTILLISIGQLIPGVGIVVNLLGWVLIGLILCLMIFQFPFGLFKLDSEGVTLYVGFKKYNHKWAEFKYVDFFRVTAEQVGPHSMAHSYWIYFSNLPIAPFSGTTILWQAGKTLDKAACFQYRTGIGKILKKVLPDSLKTEFIRKEEELFGSMNFVEKVYNK